MSDDDKLLARRFYDFLEKRYDAGMILPTKPMSSTKIIEEAAKVKVSLTTRKIQQLTQFLRTDPEWRVLIGSTSAQPMGYSLCKTPQEFMKMNGHLKSRAIADFSAYWLPLRKYQERQTLDLDLDDPVIKALIKEFDAVVVE